MKYQSIAFDDVIDNLCRYRYSRRQTIRGSTTSNCRLTTIDGLQGKSIQDSFEKNAGEALVKGGAVRAVGEILSDIDIEIGGEFETPEWIEKAGDVIVEAGTEIESFVEPVVKPAYEAVKKAGDVVEPVAKAYCRSSARKS